MALYQARLGGILGLLAAGSLLAQSPPRPTPAAPAAPATPAAVPPLPRPAAITITTNALPRTKPVIVRPAAPVVNRPPRRNPRIIGPFPPRRVPPRILPRTRSVPALTTPADALAFDATLKELTTEPGQTKANFTFYLTNTANVEVAINNVHTSCGCTAAKLPAQPWKIPPGGSGPIGVTVDLRGKRGVLTKSITIQSTSGVKSLLVKISIPDARTGFVNRNTGGMLDTDRVQNIQKSLVDRQIVFKDKSCAQCHADKAVGKTGKALYDVACAICHEAPHRATMVTDFKQKHPGLAEGWRQWIRYGKTNTLMPAFAKSQGGILTDQQIDSLVEYVTEKMPPVFQFSGPASVPAGVKPAFTPSPRAIARRPITQPPLKRIPQPRPPKPRFQRPTPPPVPAVPEPKATPINPFPFPDAK